MNILFLDFDGVVNTPWWYKDENDKWNCRYFHPKDGKLNNEQAIQWVSEFCQLYNYSIVVTSTWRKFNFDCKTCLYDSGLRDNISVIGSTPVLHTRRGIEISQWLSEHPEYTNYLIFDDENDVEEHEMRLVQVSGSAGFTEDHFNHAVSLHKAFNVQKEAK